MFMLHRIPVNIIDVARKVFIVTDEMFPISRLPDAALTLSAFALGAGRQTACKACFQLGDARRKIMIVVRQTPNEVHVLRQDYGSDRFKRARLGDIAPRRAQQVDFSREQIAPPIIETNSQKIGSAVGEEASVVRHRYYR